MPTAYTCDTCKKVSTTIEGWFAVSVTFSTGAGVPDLLFDTLKCRQAWCEKAGITDPGEQSVRMPPSFLRQGPTLPADVQEQIAAALHGPQGS